RSTGARGRRQARRRRRHRQRERPARRGIHPLPCRPPGCPDREIRTRLTASHIPPWRGCARPGRRDSYASRACAPLRRRLPWLALVLLGGVLRLQHLTTAIGAAVGAGMVRLSGLTALRANGQLGQLDLVMRAAVALTRVRVTFLR